MMRGVVLGVVLAAAVVQECCDSDKHRLLEDQQRIVKLCEERGGVPILETESEKRCDQGGHCFRVLKQCSLPGGPVMLRGEK